MSGRLSTAIAIAGALASGWACGNPSGEGGGCGSTGADVVITARDDKTFDKPTVNLVKGAQRVCWQNPGSLTHTVTATSSSPSDTAWTSNTFNNNLSPGDVVLYNFTSTGQYVYHCAIHPGMTGTVNVP